RVDAGARRPHRLDLVAADAAGHRHRAVEQEGEALRGSPFGRDDRPGRVGDDVAVLGHPGELLVVEVGEEEQLSQLVGGEGRAHRSSRYRCTRVTAMAPSPTAEATRFTDADLPSPA